MSGDVTHLIMVRHGETDYNAQKRFQGQFDAPLNDHGRAQARAVADRLRAEDITRVYTSDLSRASETAATIVGHDTARRDADLRERHFGEWQGRSHAEIVAEDPEGRAALSGAVPDYAPPGGETWRDFSQRSWRALERIVAAEPGEIVLVVTHGGVLRAIANQVLGLPIDAPRRFSITNCAINRLRFSANTWQLDTWGDASHLAELGFIQL